MTKLIRELLSRPGYRYLLVGGSVYLLELIIILVAQWAGAGPVVAVAISYAIGTLVSFGLQKLVTFGDKRLHHKILVPQLVATIALVAFNFGFTVLVTKLLANVCPAVVSRTIALLITTIWNFYLYKTRIFNQSKEPAIL
jgi:putative flippase GtrA